MNEQVGARPETRPRTGRRLFWLSFVVAAIAVLFGWSAAENAANLRTCELTIGALNDANARIEIRRVTVASFTHVIRIDYDVTPPGSTRGFSRFVSCQFAAARTPPYTEFLAAVDTESGPLPNSKFYLMRRFYLDTSEARNARIPFADSDISSFSSAAAHALEWFLSVLSRAAIYGVMAGLYLWFAALSEGPPVYRTLSDAPPDSRAVRPGRRFQVLGTVLAGPLTMVGALAMTGIMSPLAIILAVLAGLVGIACFRLVIEEYRRLAAHENAVSVVHWLVFSILIGLALFWFPDQGAMHIFRAPAWLFRPLPLIALGGHAVSTTAISALMIVAVLLFLLAGIVGQGAGERRKTNALLLLIGLIAIPLLAGIVTAVGFLQFGMALNPLLLGTKAALIALLVLALTGRDRYLALLPVSLVVVTFEYAIAPLMSTMAADAASYALVVLLLLIFLTKRQSLSPER